MHLDAAWHIARCEECRTNTTRQACAAQSRHLPTPGLAGDVIGFDIKTVTPHDQSPRWNMLVAVDFCTRKTWAWSMDDKAATLTNVQNIMIRCKCPKSYTGKSIMFSLHLLNQAALP